LSHRVETKSGDELGQLADSFNKMTQNTQKTIVSKDYMDNIIESMINSLIVLSPDGIVKMVNRATLALLGYEEDELIGKSIETILAEDDPLIETLLVGVVEEASARNEERTYISRDGRGIPVLFSSSIMRDDSGSIQGIVCVAQDITERKRAKEELLRSKQLLQNVFESIAFGIIIVDREKTVKDINPAALELIQQCREDVVGSTCHRYICPENVGSCPVLDKGDLLDRRETFIVRADGQKVPILKSVVPIEIEGEECLIESFVEITERKQAEGTLEKQARELESAYSELELANQNLEEQIGELNMLLYTMSHDLKAPAVSLQGFSSLLIAEYGDCVGDVGSMYLDRIQTNSERIGNLIERLLELFRIGRMKIKEEPIDITALLRNVTRDLSSRFEDKGIKILVMDRIPMVNCDRAMMSQIFTNLISNASKYIGEDNGNPTIEIGYEERDNYHMLHIKDNGIGIDERYHEKIFQILQRLNDIKTEGTGIGLTIAKKAVEKIGGRIWVDSARGKGTTMYFTVPKAERS